MMRRENGRVVIEISLVEWEALLVTLGIAVGAVSRNSPIFPQMVRLINVINEGNPNFTPYEIPAD